MGHGVHAGLGGLVGEEPNGADRGDRRNVDDTAAPLGAHHRQDVLASEKNALQVHGEDTIPGVFFEMGHARVAVPDAYVVVEDIDAAEALDASVRDPLAVLLPRRVRLEGDGLTALLCDQLASVFGRLEAPIYQQHPGPFACVEDRGGSPVPNRVAGRLASANNDRHFVFQSISHSVLLMFRIAEFTQGWGVDGYAEV